MSRIPTPATIEAAPSAARPLVVAPIELQFTGIFDWCYFTGESVNPVA
jgi:hypothetical protein